MCTSNIGHSIQNNVTVGGLEYSLSWDRVAKKRSGVLKLY